MVPNMSSKTYGTLENVMRFMAETGIVFPTGEIYAGKGDIAGFYTFGPMGSRLVENIKQLWRDFFIRRSKLTFEIDGSTLTPRIIWIASGHLESFWDPLVICKKCGKIYRADQLIEEILNISVEGKSIKELEEIIKKNEIKCPSCGGELGKIQKYTLMFQTNSGPLREGEEPNLVLRPETAQVIFISYKRVKPIAGKHPFGVAQIGRSYRDEISPRRGLFRLREFNQMEIEFFVLREPTCVPFSETDVNENPKKRELIESIKKQYGKVRYAPKCGTCKECPLNNAPEFDTTLRNVQLRILTRDEQINASKEGREPKEIVMRAEDAVKNKILPNEWMAYCLAKETLFLTSLGIPKDAIRFREMLPEETPHYSAGNFDLEIRYDFGWKEAIGNAYRTDYDLTRHMKVSGAKLYEKLEGKIYIPHVIEPSFGIERILLGLIMYAYRKGEDRGYEWLALPPVLAPFKAAVLPLLMPRDFREKERELALKIWHELIDKTKYFIAYDDSGNIGRRYARQDQKGTPYCITIDAQTLSDNTVTIRFRDTKEQKRVPIDQLDKILTDLIEGKRSFNDL